MLARSLILAVSCAGAHAVRIGEEAEGPDEDHGQEQPEKFHWTLRQNANCKENTCCIEREPCIGAGSRVRAGSRAGAGSRVGVGGRPGAASRAGAGSSAGAGRRLWCRPVNFGHKKKDYL